MAEIPWSTLHAHVHQTLRSRLGGAPSGASSGLLPRGSRLVVAVSGGQDSLCLLRLLIDLRRQWHWQLHSVHCNHGWRADAAANAEFVVRLSQDWGVPCQVETAESPVLGEAAARHWRYQVLTKVAQDLDCTHVVTGHTASDRAETLLYNLLRGSGADGLQALTWQRLLSPAPVPIWVVRPLLTVTRAQTAQFCQDWAIPVWQDVTNQDCTYARNRLRLEVLPQLRQAFNPQVDTTLAQTAEILSAEVEFLETTSQAIAEQCLVEGHLQRRRLRQAPLAIQRRVVRQWLRQRLPTAPHFDHIEKLVVLLQAPNRSRSDPFPGGAIALVCDPWIQWVAPETAPNPTDRHTP